MFDLLRKFRKDRRGAFAMQFALMAIPLCICTGLAIDGGRAFLARFELASALDAAALAVGSTIDEGADLDDIARKYVEINFKTEHDEPITLTLDSNDDRAILTGTVKINTYFMPLVGQNYVEVTAESEVRRGGNNVEVALALDITQSMAGTRVAALKVAAQDLIDDVVSDTQTPYFSRAAIVPWSASINVGTNHVNSGTVEELRGNLTASKDITAAGWLASGASAHGISAAGWRTNSGKSATNYTWKNGSSKSVSNMTKTNSNSRIKVTTSSNHGYSNGDTVYITGANGSYTGLNGNKYTVADKTSTTFWLYNLGTTTYTTPPSGSSDASSGTSQKCATTSCEITVTASSHGFATSDLIYINGVGESSTGTSVNNTWGTTWTITKIDNNTFSLNGTNGPGFKSFSSNGTASECYVSDCRYQITTSASHGLSATDDVFIWGISETGSGTSAVTSAGSSIHVSSPSGSVFYLSGNGNTYKDVSSVSSAYVGKCALSTCLTSVTAASHGFSTGDYVHIASATGMTSLNNSSSNPVWTITKLTSDTFTLDNSSPAVLGATAYGSGGKLDCIVYGCAWMRFTDDSSNIKAYKASNCLVERYGGYNDDTPATSPLGILYTSTGSCTATNYVTPLTSDKTRLTASINALSVSGSTAGQLGAAWAWYMLSPNFDSIWDKESDNQPKSYDTHELVKVAVLMTDGEFNTATCSGVPSMTWGSGTQINCDPDDSPYEQAEAYCDAMKDKDIVIYTVGFDIDTNGNADEFLTGCATSPAYAYLAADATELQKAFQQIATSISKLRLAR